MLVGCLRNLKVFLVANVQCIQGLSKDQPVVEGKYSALWTWKHKIVWIPVSNILYYFWASRYYLDYFPFF